MFEISATQHRLYEKLYDDLGNDIASLLQCTDVNEIMLNPDGTLWIDSATTGLTQYGHLSRSRANSIINAISGINNVVITNHNPRVETELPFFKTMNGERFSAQIPPLVSSPSFSIRKKTPVVFTLENYLATKRVTPKQIAVLQQLINQRKNIVVCGGPGSGKTTVTNALIAEAIKVDPAQRFVILEDTAELQCSAANKLTMLTTKAITMNELLRVAMRMRPDRILIGEVRGKEALDLLKAWNTGCPGGISTIHANGPLEAIQRIVDLALEAGLSQPPITLVLHTIDAIVFVSRENYQKGFIKQIVALKEYVDEKFIIEELA